VEPPLCTRRRRRRRHIKTWGMAGARISPLVALAGRTVQVHPRRVPRLQPVLCAVTRVCHTSISIFGTVCNIANRGMPRSRATATAPSSLKAERQERSPLLMATLPFAQQTMMRAATGRPGSCFRASVPSLSRAAILAGHRRGALESQASTAPARCCDRVASCDGRLTGAGLNRAEQRKTLQTAPRF
jgi:hypothetical protein